MRCACDPPANRFGLCAFLTTCSRAAPSRTHAQPRNNNTGILVYVVFGYQIMVAVTAVSFSLLLYYFRVQMVIVK
jgi:hypothetical protein